MPTPWWFMGTDFSVVIPALNAGATIENQLRRLGEQEGSVSFEIIVADNGSTDCTVAKAVGWRGGVPIRVIRVNQKGPSAARNGGARAAKGSVLAFTDADDEVSPQWLCGARSILSEGGFGSGPLGSLSQVLSPATNPTRHMGFLPYAFGTNFFIKRELFFKIGGFREDFRVGEDVELSWRLQLNGYPLKWLDSLVFVRDRSNSRQVLAQYFAYGRADPRLFALFHGRGARRSVPSSVAKSYLGLAARLPLLSLPSVRRAWLHQLGRRAGRIVGSVSEGVLYL